MRRLRTMLLLLGCLICFLVSSCGVTTRNTETLSKEESSFSPAFTSGSLGNESGPSSVSAEVSSSDSSSLSLPSSPCSFPSGNCSGTTEPTEPSIESFTLGFTGDVCFAENYKIYQLAKKNNRELLDCFSPTHLPPARSKSPVQ